MVAALLLADAAQGAPARDAHVTIPLHLSWGHRTPARSATVNGKAWDDFDPRKEWVRIASPESRRYAIAVRY